KQSRPPSPRRVPATGRVSKEPRRTVGAIAIVERSDCQRELSTRPIVDTSHPSVNPAPSHGKPQATLSQLLGDRSLGRLLSRLKSGAILLADRGYDGDWIRTLVRRHGAWVVWKRHRRFSIDRTDTNIGAWSVLHRLQYSPGLAYFDTTAGMP